MQTVTITYKCDRCGKEFDRPPSISYAIGSYDKDGNFKAKDLCTECANKLIDFMVKGD